VLGTPTFVEHVANGLFPGAVTAFNLAQPGGTDFFRLLKGV